MCWSATADLAAGAGIAAIGMACVTRVSRVRDLLLAALPLLLGAHQIIESVVWRSGGGAGPTTTAWAVIALPLLPVWVPLAVLLAAPARARLRLLVPAAAGLATAATLAYALVTGPVTAAVRGHTVGYGLGLPHSPLIIAGYLLATIGSLLLSGEPLLWLLGVLVAAGSVICSALWRLEFISTGCAFAAVASVVLYAWVRRRPTGPPPDGMCRVDRPTNRH
ncbi:hypothetical protein QMK19_26790 [Streptomyces sp. H10-C2]|uniref:DUF6629 family protein n=1 Tax=unclassified Streptomyces TaxID=2593676 RepID=UPI0024B88424|nr:MULTISPECIES: DUF6629 family protein [unclassified Streptomyces]MDJ0343585.1 hypothetical protein [Streptomyces sp. PH10-H1]MDJ0373167.1 hypothetical protein [Streptomyces sp. H10-C2]